MRRMKVDEIIPAHQFTDANGEVLIVKCTNADRVAYGGFVYPAEVGAVVEASDWNPEATCGSGVHGWAWGLGIGEGKEADYHGVWYVLAVDPKDVVNLSGKCKFPRGTVRYVGQWAGALIMTLAGRIAYTVQASSGSASNSGSSGSASNSGYSGSASNSGSSGSASNSGYSGSASNSGYSGSASNSGSSGSASNSGSSGSASNSGYSGSASNSGYGGSASTAAKGTAAICTGLYSQARAAEFGCIALAWWNEKERRTEMRCATTGVSGQLSADTWYRLNEAGEFVEAGA